MTGRRDRSLATTTAAAAIAAVAFTALPLTGCGASRHGLRARRTADAPAAELAAARYRGRLTIGEKKVSFRAHLYASRPDSLRAELFTPLGQAIVILTARQGRARAMIPRERLWWEGDADDATLGRVGFLGGAPFWADLLTGAAVGTERATDGADGRERIVVFDGVDGDSLRVRPASRDGEPPDRLSANVVRGGREVSIVLERRSFLDPADRAAAYVLEVPGSFRRLDDLDLIAMIAESDPDPQ